MQGKRGGRTVFNGVWGGGSFLKKINNLWLGYPSIGYKIREDNKKL